MGHSKIVDGSVVYILSPEQEKIHNELLKTVIPLKKHGKRFDRILIGWLLKKGNAKAYHCVYYTSGWGLVCKLYPGSNGSVYELSSACSDDYVFVVREFFVSEMPKNMCTNHI